MIGPVFVDTNVFVYRRDDSIPAKQLRAEQWIRLLAHGRTGRLSFQVLQELYATLTRKQLNFDRSEVREIIKTLAAWQPVKMDFAIMERAWMLQEGCSPSWWDALIVAAAQTGECAVLLTEDLQHGQTFDSVRVLNPFASAERTPEAVLNASDP